MTFYHTFYKDNNVAVSPLCVDFHVNGMIGCVAEAISTVITGVGVAVHVQFLVNAHGFHVGKVFSTLAALVGLSPHMGSLSAFQILFSY